MAQLYKVGPHIKVVRLTSAQKLEIIFAQACVVLRVQGSPHAVLTAKAIMEELITRKKLPNWDNISFKQNATGNLMDLKE